MKSDKELLKELLEYFDGVMDDVVEGKPFEKVDVPDYSGHELEFRIDMMTERFQDMMNAYLVMKDSITRISDNLESLAVMSNIYWKNANDSLGECEKRTSVNNKENE